jgi:signal transduction histidine kinase
MLLDMISRNSARINQLISDLLNSTRANLLAFDDANIHTLLDETIELAQDRIELKKIKVIKQYADGICNISVDIQKIKIAFLNIIVNAIEAMEEGAGVLTVRTETKDSKCVVLISDNGKGIPAEDISRLFEPYYTTKENGTGLGLTNTQNIILSHKASISVQSESGKGTTFMITFNVKK